MIRDEYIYILICVLCDSSKAPRDNGSPIKTYILQWDKGAGDGKYHEIYNGDQKQTKVSHKLAPGTKCVFRVQAINEIGPRLESY